MIRFYKQTNKGYFRQVAPQFFPAPEPIDPMAAVESQAIVQRLRTIHKDPAQWTAELDRLAEEGYVPELIFIDAGLVTSLDTTNRRNFLDLFQAVAEFDGYKAGHLMAERCSRPELVLDAETFALKIQHLVLGVKSTTFSLAAIKISDILTEMLKNVRQHHVKLEGDFVNTVISILLLEGIGRTLDKDLDLLASALPILRQVGRQMGTNDAMSQVPKGNIWAMAKVSPRSNDKVLSYNGLI
jgi:aarF domain-containing kinase